MLTPEQRTEVQRTLFRAYCDRDIAGMEAALMEGAQAGWIPQAGAEQSEPLLHMAAGDDRVDAVRLLLNWGADVEAHDREGRTALYHTSRWNSPKAARELLEAGADYRHACFGGGSLAAALQDAVTHDYDDLAALIEEYEGRPNISLSNEPERLKERLFRRDKQHFTPLDNPQTWKNFDAVHGTLMAQGTPITKDEWFDVNGRGERWIDVAVRFRALDKVLGHLHAQGERLTVDELLNDEPLLEAICDKGGVRHLFTREQLQGEGVEGMRRLQAQLPDSALAQVRNNYALTAWLQRDMQQAQGRGR